MSALTSNGLVIDRLPEVIEKIVETEKQLISPNVNTDSDTLLGQINTVVAEQVSRVLELVQAVNDNFNINTAEGKNLDDLAVLKNLQREEAAYTQGYVDFTGTPTTTININTTVSNPITGDKFKTSAGDTLNTNRAVYANVEITTVQNSTAYSIVINSTTYTYISDGSATALEIAEGLETEINDDVDRAVEVVLNGTDLQLTTNDVEFSIYTSVNLNIDVVTTKIYVVSDTLGSIEATSGVVTRIVTPISGLTSVVNSEDLIIGRERETDEEFRLRIKTSSSTQGKATKDAITTRLRDTDGVSYAIVYENDTTIEDGDGRPPKSFEAVVQGGTDEDVAATIWEVKGCGIETFGSETVATLDIDGQSQEVKFSRPTAVNVAIRVWYVLYTEEDLPVNAVDAVKASIVETVNALGINEDLITGRLYNAVYSATSGLGQITIQAQELANPGDTPVELDWAESTLAINAREYAVTTLADVYVLED